VKVPDNDRVSMLSESEKHLLLQIARQSVEAVVNKRGVPRIQISQPALREHRAAFVTLHEHQELRGCIGYVDPIKPLWETVQDAAAKAALDDPRFSSVQPEELREIEIEISVLSPLKEIGSAEEIEIGRHGVVVELGRHRGLLLPQVAVSMGWDKETFFLQTLRKSGLPPALWKSSELRTFTFSAEVFSETPVSQV
jgi:AmmeMemoRadiSam system protein A